MRGTGTQRSQVRTSRRFIPACAGNSASFTHFPASYSVHPRVCGEQSAVGPGDRLSRGSSPRVRGTVLTKKHTCGGTRFIPACAGNSLDRGRISSLLTVHPRVCGEQAPGHGGDADRGGSSPRVRGTVVIFGSAIQCSPVHPRVCGEQAGVTTESKRPIGSSPRVRGTVNTAPSLVRQCRFIPACAGNRNQRRFGAVDRAVHPRVCGEQAVIRCTSTACAGSSPRVRGTVCWVRVVTAMARFIPACAGNSGAASGTGAPDAVHPRVCGEQFRRITCQSDFCGSSPRVRGTERSPWPGSGIRRFIPACAGNRVPPSPRAFGLPVHPRVCGEQPIPLDQPPQLIGSSPRVRGTGCL